FLRDGEAAGKVRRVVFAPQSIVPAVRQQRLAVLAGLADVAAAGYEVVIKLRARAGERQTHNENRPYEVLWRAEHHRLGHPHAALRFVDGPMHTWLTPDAALVTVSSTAALESLALGLPTVLVSDFGIAEELLNEPFAGSGCLAPLVDVPDLLAHGGPRPDPDWLEQNYLHTAPSELPRAVAELAAARPAGGRRAGAGRRAAAPRGARAGARGRRAPARAPPAPRRAGGGGAAGGAGGGGGGGGRGRRGGPGGGPAGAGRPSGVGRE